MQQKRSGKKIFLLILLLLLGVAAFLMFRDIPAPSGPIEVPVGTQPAPAQ